MPSRGLFQKQLEGTWPVLVMLSASDLRGLSAEMLLTNWAFTPLSAAWYSVCLSEYDMSFISEWGILHLKYLTQQQQWLLANDWKKDDFCFDNWLIIFQAQMPNIYWFWPLKCEYVLLFFLIHDCKLNILGF